MIRSVKIPTGVSRMGCAPGAGCCDECGSHAPAMNLGALVPTTSTGRRHAALHSNLGDTTCDDQGNCYQVTSSVSYGAPVDSAAPAASAPGSNSGLYQMNNTTTFMVVGVAIIAALEIFSRSDSGSRRRR